MAAPIRAAILGATGSIGRQALDVARALGPERLRVVALSAHSDEAGLLAAAAMHPGAALCLSAKAPSSPAIQFSGGQGLLDLIAGCGADVVLNGVAGAAGLAPSLAALRAGARLALANKESVVMAGRLVLDEAAKRGLRVLPVDSEHAGVFALTERFGMAVLDEIVLTASGGAFRDRPLDSLDSVGPEEASTHPNWSMGAKITIDSATMANKGLEVIEAARLFGLPGAAIKVLVHPQSRVHALVRTRDGTLYAQVSEPDMRVPIQNALLYPELEPCAFGRLELAGARLDFYAPEPRRYPLLSLAYDALEAGEGATVAYNAANEEAVSAFRASGIIFTDIARVVAAVLAVAWPARLDSLDEVMAADNAARSAASVALKGYAR